MLSWLRLWQWWIPSMGHSAELSSGFWDWSSEHRVNHTSIIYVVEENIAYINAYQTCFTWMLCYLYYAWINLEPWAFLIEIGIYSFTFVLWLVSDFHRVVLECEKYVPWLRYVWIVVYIWLYLSQLFRSHDFPFPSINLFSLNVY